MKNTDEMMNTALGYLTDAKNSSTNDETVYYGDSAIVGMLCAVVTELRYIRQEIEKLRSE